MKPVSTPPPVRAGLFCLATLVVLLFCIQHSRAQGNQPSSPPPDGFVAVEKEATVDLAAVQKRLVYPELARRAGLEGKVVLRVLVGKDGKAKKYGVVESTHQWFTEEAGKALMQAAYTPAIMEGQPIEMWLTVPIQFRLRGTPERPRTPVDALLDTPLAGGTNDPALALYNRGLIFYILGRDIREFHYYDIARQTDSSRQWKPYSEAGLEEILGITVDETNAELLVARAGLLLEYSTDHALADYTRAIEAKPDYAPAYEGRANLYYRIGNYQEAVADAGTLLGMGTSDAEANAVLGKSLYALGRYSEALDHLTVAVELQPDNISYRCSMAKQ